MSAVQKLAAAQARERILDPADPMQTARELIAERYEHADGRLLHHHKGAFYEWTGVCFRLMELQAMRAVIYEFTEPAIRITLSGPIPFKPTAAKINNIVDALSAVAHLSEMVAPPAWLTKGNHPPAGEIVLCANGALHLPTLKMASPTPAMFATNALDVPFDRDAGDPKRWLEFLDQLWPDDPESIDTLQELFGYLLVPDTRLQKIFLLVGPKRGGKGTIARVMTALLGRDNVCAPTLASFGTNFGLAPLIGKNAAIIADARLSGRADQAQIAERLLSISGEDNLTVDRKYLPAWTGQLGVRFILLTNELPRIADASGALASRFIVLQLTKSFYGREDHRLSESLLTELPEILFWAVEGWRRLTDRGYFVQPASAREAIQELEDLGAPINAFIRDECEIGPHCEVTAAELFARWQTWCERNGREHPGTAQSFGRDLRAALPTLSTARPREDGKRSRIYQGITITNSPIQRPTRRV